MVEEWVEEAARRYNRARVRLDPYQAVHLAQRLKRRGIQVQEFTFSAASVGRLATVLLQLIRERSLALPDDPELLDELRNVRLKEPSPGVFRLEHDRNRHDDRAVALALAASLLAERGATSGRSRTWSSFQAEQGTLVERRRRAHGLPRRPARERKWLVSDWAARGSGNRDAAHESIARQFAERGIQTGLDRR